MITEKDILPFNSPLETGLRSTTLLWEAFPDGLDLQRLIHYDYLVVHSGDVHDGPPSLHPPTPFRGTEVLVRRDLIRAGLALMLSRGLIAQKATKDGVVYQATDEAASFLQCLKNEYVCKMRDRSAWCISKFRDHSASELRTFITNYLDSWGGEFEMISESPEEYE